jgi:hypothetical protein
MILGELLFKDSVTNAGSNGIKSDPPISKGPEIQNSSREQFRFSLHIKRFQT